jgi:hypothetical protein
MDGAVPLRQNVSSFLERVAIALTGRSVNRMRVRVDLTGPQQQSAAVGDSRLFERRGGIQDGATVVSQDDVTVLSGGAIVAAEIWQQHRDRDGVVETHITSTGSANDCDEDFGAHQ